VSIGEYHPCALKEFIGQCDASSEASLSSSFEPRGRSTGSFIYKPSSGGCVNRSFCRVHHEIALCTGYAFERREAIGREAHSCSGRPR
jgi:hypothetical protein